MVTLENTRSCDNIAWRWRLLLTMSFLEGIIKLPSASGDDFCVMESLDASCSGSDVIVMRSALYGRMRLGRCVRTDFGFVGCSVDVLGMADSRCSGRSSCTISVPDPEFEAAQFSQCNEEFKSYLEADYDCLKVTVPDTTSCSGSTHVTARGNHGFLASSVTADTGCGGDVTPWVIEALPGQVVNLTLWDFGAEQNRGFSEDNSCDLYAYVKDSSMPAGRPVCGGSHRKRHIFTASGHSVHVYISQSRAMSETGAFLIEYQVTGCSDPAIPDHGWVRREDQVAYVGCGGSSEGHRLQCEGSEWQGTVPVCQPVDDQSKLITSSPRVFNLSSGVAILLVLGIAVVISAFILAFGVCLIKRKHNYRKENHPYQTTTLSGMKSTSMKPSLSDYSQQYSPHSGDNHYSYVWEPSSDPYVHQGPRASGHSGQDLETGPPHPQYFELDPAVGGKGPTYEPVVLSDYPKPCGFVNRSSTFSQKPVLKPGTTFMSNKDNLCGEFTGNGPHQL